ncbi:hypothetical protein HDR59_02660 [bacterium]|nr:hypothetical protein [bacterium]
MIKNISKFILLLVCSFFIIETNSSASFWDLWENEDEESNMKSDSVSKNYTNETRNKTDKSSKTTKQSSTTTKKTTQRYETKTTSYTGMTTDETFFDINEINNSKPIVICRQKGCTELNDKMTQSYLFNSLANLLYINDKTKVYLCEANTNTRACISNGLKYAVNIGGTAGVIYIPSLTITDVSFSKNLKRINFMLSYDLYANGLKNFCTSAHNTIEISANKQALIRDNNYNCQLTSDLPSTSYNIYNIDYIDLDYGIIGAYYSTGMTGASSGGNTGYVLMKFQYTDANLKKPQTNCLSGTCDSESYKIAPGQYEVIPIDGKIKDK